MEVWSFEEKFGQGGHVLEPMRKSWPKVPKGRGPKVWKKRAQYTKKGTAPWPAGDQGSPIHGRPPTATRSLTVCGTPIFCDLKKKNLTFFFGSVENGPGLLGEWVYSTLIFLSLPLHLEVLNLEYTWTYISTVGIFVSWKIKITKNSVRFASVMEMFCTLLQCRVYLSMFHSSSTSKIWHTST
jgi:hypothetical protein